MYWLTYVDEAGARHAIGAVKIGEFGRNETKERTRIPPEFEQLDDAFFSLGPGDDYYVGLNTLSDDTRLQILAALNDMAYDLDRFERAQFEPVTITSLLREMSTTEVKGQLHRLAHGGIRLTEYSFEYRRQSPNDGEPIRFGFNVTPDSQPPTNIHVIVGSNGVGKTRLLNEMALAQLDPASLPVDTAGQFVGSDPRLGDGNPFAGLVFVSFSAFDPQHRLANLESSDPEFRYTYVGFQTPGAESEDIQDGLEQLESAPIESASVQSDVTAEFVRSVAHCREVPRRNRWKRALATLETDPIFEAANVSNLVDQSAEEASETFLSLSSGHSIVLLTMTRLVETVEEKSLVVIDEPEAHLHPPLLSAFVRALSNLLVDRNGVAILATHSPVVLQEVPQSCVWKLRRHGAVTRILRPEIETFGENVGVLTREVFGLEVTDSGFHHLLSQAVRAHDSYEAVVEAFDGRLGGEARALLRAMVASKAMDDESPA
jgi:predicted ATPase